MLSLVRKTRNSKREPDRVTAPYTTDTTHSCLLPAARASHVTGCPGGHSSTLEQNIQYISPSSVVLDYTYHVTILTKM